MMGSIRNLRTVLLCLGISVASGSCAITNALEDGETRDNSSGASCSRNLAGSYTVANSDDASEIYDVCNISGDLIIDAPGMLTLELPSLITVGGEFLATDQDLSVVSLPALKEVSRISFSSSATSVNFDFSRLETVTSDFEIRAKGSVLLPELRNIGGTARIELQSSTGVMTAPKLESVTVLLLYDSGVITLSLPALEQITNLELRQNFLLETITAIPAIGGANPGMDIWIEDSPALDSLSAFDSMTLARSLSLTNTGIVDLSELGANLSLECCLNIIENPSILSVSVPGLSTLLGGFQVERNPLITSFVASNVTTLGAGEASGHLQIDDNPNLVQLGLPLWTAATSSSNFEITNNPLLPTCEVQAIADRVVGGSFTISGNDDLAVCD